MSEPFEQLAIYETLSPSERAELDRVMQDNPALAEAFAGWNSLRASVRKELVRDLPDRTLLVLYALADEAEEDVLTAAEKHRLANARDELEGALERHPGLVDAVRRIRQDREAFNFAWSTHTSKNGHRTPIVETSDDRPQMQLVRQKPASRWVWRIAAMIAVVLCGTLMTYLVQRDAGFVTITASEQMAVEFPDGSMVELMEGSVLMMPESENVREARLMAGNALFDIRHDESHPFIVESHNAVVTVLGTSFGMNVTEVETSVVLVSGSVSFSSNGHRDEPVLLEPGERSTVMALEVPEQPTAADVNASLEWTGDLFIRSEPMSRVAQRLSYAFDVSVEVASELANEVVSGTRFDREAGVEAALQELALALGAEITETPDGSYRLE